MSIKKVKTNVKSRNGEPYEVEIGEKTLLIGPNESGKSSIVEAIQLACHGQVHGLLMRSGQVKSSTQLSTLTPSDMERVFAEVELTDGNTCFWEMLSGRKPALDGGGNHIAMPMAQLKSVLSGSSDKAIEFFFERLVSTVTVEDIENNIKPETLYSKEGFESLLPDLGQKNLSKSQKTTIYASDLVDMLSDAKRLQRENRALGKTLDSSLKHLGNAAPVVDSDMHDLWEDLFKALKVRFGKDFLSENPGVASSAQVFGSIGTAKELKSLKGSAVIVDEITDMLQAQAEFKLARRVRDQTVEALKTSSEMGQVAKALQESIHALTSQYLEAYSSRVSESLPEGDVFKAQINGGKFTFGLEREGHLHQAMSGSTEVRVLAAMASALLKTKEEAILILDDRMWDPNTLSKTMAALESSPAQVIIMSTVKPRGRKRGDWTYVEVGSSPDEEENAE